MPGSSIVTLLSSGVLATGTCSRRTPSFRYSVDLDEGSSGVPYCLASSAFSTALKHQTSCYQSTGAYFLQVKLMV